MKRRHWTDEALRVAARVQRAGFGNVHIMDEGTAEEMAKKRAKAKARAVKAAQDLNDNRPWYDRAESGFFNPEPGQYTLLITDEIRERVNNFGNRVIDIPTNKGTLSTGSFALMRPLAQTYKRAGTVKGARISMTVTGIGQARRFNDVVVQMR